MRHDSGPSLHLRWGRKQWLSLKHADLASAKHAAKKRSATLLAQRGAAGEKSPRMAKLFEMYELAVTPTKSKAQQREDKRRIKLWTYWLGPESDPMKLTGDKLKAFERARRAGTVACPGLKLKAARSKAIREDLVFLRAVFNWAAGMGSGNLLSRNPMAGYKLPHEVNPRRPLLYHEDYLALTAKAPEIDPLLAPFLTLVETLGWRVSAICSLRVSDIDVETTATRPYGRLLKRAETDKVGVCRWTIIGPETKAALTTVSAGKIGDAWLFPATGGTRKAPGGPWTRHWARKLLLEAWGLTEVPKERQVAFHAFRRAWVSARRHLPRTLVAEQGAWLSPRTLDIYDVPDEAGLLSVAVEPAKVRRAPNA